MSYTRIARIIHWSMVPLLIGLVALGLWMTELSYNDPWYHRAPALHDSLGVVAFFLLIIRFIWRMLHPAPPHSARLKPWEKKIAQLVQVALYLLMATLPISGYFITTAKGMSVDVFSLFSIPALFHTLPGMEDKAGDIHQLLAWTLTGLVIIHSAAALKHHFLDRDDTLLKMVISLPAQSHANRSKHND